MEFKPKRNIKPVDYVKSKIEGPEYTRFDKNKYLKPLFKYNSFGESGDTEGKVGDLEISLSYTQDNHKIPSSNIRKLQKLMLKNNEAELDVLKLLPLGYSTYITTNVDKEDASFESIHRSGEKKIYINSPILSVDGILGLLHEIGHNLRDQNQNPSEQIKDEISTQRFKLSGILEKILAGISPRNPNSKDASRLLRDERDAWSIALHEIKPFMKDLNINIEDIENIIHHDALYSYSLLIRDNINLEKHL